MDPKAFMTMQKKRSRTFDGFSGLRIHDTRQEHAALGLDGLRALALGKARALVDASVETIWTTRCIICDKPGTLLCQRCQLDLPYIDRWLACPRCGSPNGLHQCVDCNGYSLSEIGRSAPPFIRCVSAIEHRGIARAIATGYKDAGERRLAATMAQLMANCMPRSWSDMGASIAYVPADRRARLRRGFDHMERVARELSGITGMPCVNPLQKLSVTDQRGLGRAQRFANMAHAVRPAAAAHEPTPERIVLIDDVYTTGATLFAASDALLAAGAREVRCVTFARVT